ncbi:hypothetical protein AB0L53_22015 [Nonomuraea sp. NPDC052129]|uniref:hypothetical protein n=1 Tax=Nonomuraea sp. NPDC052129 TaxID=3154651 RepID=UPI00342E4A6F
MFAHDLMNTFIAAGAGAIAGHLAVAVGRRVMHWSRAAAVSLAEATLARFSPATPGSKERNRL